MQFSLLINIIIAIPLFCCVFVANINPVNFWPSTFIGLGFLVWLGFNIFFLVYWALLKKRYFLISLITILINHNNLKANFGSFSKSKENTLAKIKIVSLNTQLLGYFQEQNNADAIIKEIKNTQADIVCLQEFLSLAPYDINYFKTKLDMPYSYFKALADGRKKGKFGMVIFSKHPIKEKGFTDFGEYTGNMALWCTISINDVLIKCYSLHLQSIRFSKKDYTVIKEGEQNINQNDAKNILRRIKIAAKVRAIQVDNICKDLAKQKLPILLCGDFNEAPVSYSYGQFTKNLKDAFISGNVGLEATYIGPFPAYRIDYIMHGTEWQTLIYKSKKVSSDHKMIVATLQWK